MFHGSREFFHSKLLSKHSKFSAQHCCVKCLVQHIRVKLTRTRCLGLFIVRQGALGGISRERETEYTGGPFRIPNNGNVIRISQERKTNPCHEFSCKKFSCKSTTQLKTRESKHFQEAAPNPTRRFPGKFVRILPENSCNILVILVGKLFQNRTSTGKRWFVAIQGAACRLHVFVAP